MGRGWPIKKESWKCTLPYPDPRLCTLFLPLSRSWSSKLPGFLWVRSHGSASIRRIQSTSKVTSSSPSRSIRVAVATRFQTIFARVFELLCRHRWPWISSALCTPVLPWASRPALRDVYERPGWLTKNVLILQINSDGKWFNFFRFTKVRKNLFDFSGPYPDSFCLIFIIS